jgi:esterase/lipase
MQNKKIITNNNMQTQFQKEWISECDTTTVEGYAKATMLRDKYEMINTETLWLDGCNDTMVNFTGNSYSAENVERNKKGLAKIAAKIFARFNTVQYVFFKHLLFKRQ